MSFGQAPIPAASNLQVTVDFIVSTHRVWLGAASGRFDRIARLRSATSGRLGSSHSPRALAALATAMRASRHLLTAACTSFGRSIKRQREMQQIAARARGADEVC